MVDILWDSIYYFLQTQDIDASETQNWNGGEGFSPIGWYSNPMSNNPFKGIYEGGYHIIDGLFINRADTDRIGLFGYTDGATIDALGVNNVNVTGYGLVGGLVGGNCNYSTINESYATGSVIGNNYSVGGLVGWNSESTITASYAMGNVTGSEYCVGGLVGTNWKSTISESYATGSATGSFSVGGLVGFNHINSTLSKCYATGFVTGNDNVGGLVGDNFQDAHIENCIWNIETTGLTVGFGENDGGIINRLLGKTTAEMQMMNTFTDIYWDFVGESVNGTEDIWDISSVLNNGYPYIYNLEWSLYDGLLANFTATPTSGSFPLTVNFMDASFSEYSTIVSWEWDFQSDGVIDSYEQNPVCLYEVQGLYSVSLTVCDDRFRETSTEFKEEYIAVYCESIQPQGSGIETAPYLVETINNLLWISNNESSWGSHFLQIQDIDASETQHWNDGAGFCPIGILDVEQNLSVPFHGTYNGNNHIIDGLNIYRAYSVNIGLFGYTNEAVIESLGITNINVTGYYDVGGLVGYNMESSVSICCITGIVNGTGRVGGLVGTNETSTISGSYTADSVTGDHYIGGLVGNNRESTISESYATGSVSGDHNIGGLVGNNRESTISESYATGSVAGDYNTGGLLGFNRASTLSESYSTGTVSGDYKIGGLVGNSWLNSTISESYTTGSVTGDSDTGGLVGYCYIGSSISNCIWNIDTSGQTSGIGYESGNITNLLGKTTAEMLMMSTYTDIGWDFVGEIVNGDEDIWGIEEDINEGYPFIYDIEYPSSNDENVIHSGGQEFKIENYPNPFNPVTNICYEVGENSDVQISIYNIKGQKVKTLVDGYCEAGKHSIIWDAENQSSGVYFIYFESGTMREVKKITLLK